MQKRLTKTSVAIIAILALAITINIFATTNVNAKESSSEICKPYQGGYLISANAKIAHQGNQKFYIKITSATGGKIKVGLSGSQCLEVNVPKTNQWQFIEIPGNSPYIKAGSHTINVYASGPKVNWSTLWITASSTQCVPNIDTVRIVCQNVDASLTKMYASKTTSLVWPEVVSSQTPITTTKPTTTTTTQAATTTKPTNTKPTVNTQPQAPITNPTTQPTTNDCFAQSAGVVSHPITLSSSGTQRVWVRVIAPDDKSSISISVDSGKCITQTLHNMSSWMWMPFNEITSDQNIGNHTIRISATQGVKLSTLIMFNSSIGCQPAGDGKNCPQETVPTTAAPAPTTATNPASPPTDHSNMDMGGTPEDNIALEQFRNTDAIYKQYANVPSDQLPLNKLTLKANPGSNIFKQEGVGKSQFRIRCDFSHLAYDDPIIKPGQPGKSHLHMFFGNTAVNGNTTVNSLINSGGSTCSGFEANRTAYWFPTVHDTQGRVRIPNEMIMYYKTEGVAKPAGGYTEMPQGLKIVAGNAMATSPQKVAYNNGWDCGSVNNNPTQALIPDNCNSGNGLMFKLHFPRCWDGSFDFDPSQPQKHVMYEINGQCPATHSKVLTGMTALIGWKLNPGETTSGWYLSSDRMPGMAPKPGGQTLHGDWWGGWNKQIMKAWHDGCVNADYNCSVGYLGINNKITGVSDGGINELVRIPYNEAKLNTPLAYNLPARKNS